MVAGFPPPGTMLAITKDLSAEVERLAVVRAVVVTILDFGCFASGLLLLETATGLLGLLLDLLPSVEISTSLPPSSLR